MVAFLPGRDCAELSWAGCSKEADLPRVRRRSATRIDQAKRDRNNSL